jgi:hypothetical protein
MESFSKYAAPPTFVSDDYVNALKSINSKLLEPLDTKGHIDGGLQIPGVGFPPYVQEKDYYPLFQATYDWQTFAWVNKYFLGLGFFIIFYWLFSPGQLFQLFNTDSTCNRLVFGKNTLGSTGNPSVQTTKSTCQTVVNAGRPSNVSLIREWGICSRLIDCSKRTRWAGYFTSTWAIIFHGFLLGTLLSLMPLIGYYTQLDMVVTEGVAYLIYAFAVVCYNIVYYIGYGFMSVFNSGSNTYSLDTSYPDFDIIKSGLRL